MALCTTPIYNAQVRDLEFTLSFSGMMNREFISLWAGRRAVCVLFLVSVVRSAYASSRKSQKIYVNEATRWKQRMLQRNCFVRFLFTFFSLVHTQPKLSSIASSACAFTYRHHVWIEVAWRVSNWIIPFVCRPCLWAVCAGWLQSQCVHVQTSRVSEQSAKHMYSHLANSVVRNHTQCNDTSEA